MIKVLNKRERIILFSTIGLIILAVLFNFILVPVLSRNEVLDKEIAVASVRLKKYKSLISKKESIREIYEKFCADAKTMEQGEPTSANVLSELENLAQVSGIKIIDIRPQPSAKSGELYQELQIDFRTEGTMPDYVKFIYNLEISPLLLRVKGFQLSAKNNATALEGSFSVSQLAPSP